MNASRNGVVPKPAHERLKLLIEIDPATGCHNFTGTRGHEFTPENTYVRPAAGVGNASGVAQLGLAAAPYRMNKTQYRRG